MEPTAMAPVSAMRIERALSAHEHPAARPLLGRPGYRVTDAGEGTGVRAVEYWEPDEQRVVEGYEQRRDAALEGYIASLESASLAWARGHGDVLLVGSVPTARQWSDEHRERLSRSIRATFAADPSRHTSLGLKRSLSAREEVSVSNQYRYAVARWCASVVLQLIDEGLFEGFPLPPIPEHADPDRFWYVLETMAGIRPLQKQHLERRRAHWHATKNKHRNQGLPPE